MVMMGTPECTDRGTRVDVEKTQSAGDLVANRGRGRIHASGAAVVT
jgi:hypothetical protein